MRVNYSNVVGDVKALPADFNQWVERNVDFQRIMFLTKTDGGYEGQCSYCKKKIEYDKKNKKKYPKRGAIGKCPKCKSEVKFRAIRDCLKFHDKNFAAYVEKIHKNTYIVRYFRVHLHTDHLKASISYEEWERTIFDSGTEKVYPFHKRTYSNWGSYSALNDWAKGEAGATRQFISYQDLAVYPSNLNTVFLSDEKIKYCCMHELALSKNPFEPITYLKSYIYNPKIEMIVKGGLYGIVRHIGCKDMNRYSYKLGYSKTRANYNIYGKNTYELLKLKNKYAVDYCIKNDISNKDLETIQVFDEVNHTINKNLLAVINKEFKNNITEIAEIIRHQSFESFLKYRKHSKCSIRDYYDYLIACEKLNYNLKDTAILKPKQFMVAHDRTISLVKIENVKEYAPKFETLYDKWKEVYEFNNEELEIKMPQTPGEIVSEGVCLSHCVGGYISRVDAKRCLILFVRQKNSSSDSFFTLEFNPTTKKIVQCRGYKNKDYSQEQQVFDFVKLWLNQVKYRFKKAI